MSIRLKDTIIDTCNKAVRLATPRTINGVSFDGTANITITANANSHTHDDRYYTESEINTKNTAMTNIINTKANAGEAHYATSLRDFVNGAIIKTICGYVDGTPWLLEITGNAYGGSGPFDFKAQGYCYNGGGTNISAISNGSHIGSISVFSLNGNICFYIPRLSYWQGYSVKFSNVGGAGRAINLVESISNGLKPTNISKNYEIPINHVFSEHHKPTWSEISGVPSTFPATSHTHDDRYYTESEITNKFGTVHSGLGSGYNYIHDTRGAVRAPSYYTRRAVRFDFSESNINGAGGDSWTALMTVSPWSSYSSSHRQQQLAFKGAGGLAFRYATSDTAWSGWNTLYSTINKPSATDVGARASSWVPTWNEVSGKPSTFAPIVGTASTQAAAGNHNHNNSYLLKSGGTVSGTMEVTGRLYCNRYSSSNNAPAIVIDKLGSGYFGVGGCGQNNVIQYGKCTNTMDWGGDNILTHKFVGDIIEHNDDDISRKYNATLNGNKWRRILHIEGKNLCTTCLLTISGTAASIVLDNVYSISSGHPGRGTITQLSSSGYVRCGVRLSVDSHGSIYVDIRPRVETQNIPICVTLNQLSGGNTHQMNEDAPSSTTGYVVANEYYGSTGLAANRFALVSSSGNRSIEYHTRAIGDGDVGGQWLEFYDVPGNSVGYIGSTASHTNAIFISSKDYVVLESAFTLSNPAGNGSLYADFGGYFRPEHNSRWDIGHSSYRYGTIYYINLSAPSDRNSKSDISYIDTGKRTNRLTSNSKLAPSLIKRDLYEFIKNDLRIANYDYRGFGVDVDDDDKNSAGRDKLGFIAQDVENTIVGRHLIKKHTDGKLSYDITNYVNIIAGALQEEINQKDETILALEDRISKLEKALETLIR